VSDYNEYGFEVIDDFLPEDVASKIELMFLGENNKWEHTTQVHDRAYGEGEYGKHKTDNPKFPKEDEEYLAKFWRSNKLELEVNDIFNEYFFPKIKEISHLELVEYDVRCNKLESGDHYRSHIDNYAGGVGCVYYINKKWCWDWGGILHIGIGDELKSIFPKYNRLMILNNTKFSRSHFITPVNEWAHQPRFSLISFNKDKNRS
tara:strand:+ start:31 stop:642 length:612 start_codon:yes stop_codon:yes gene_type:complete